MIFIAFGQLDLLLVRLASDLVANCFTLNMYLDGKIYDPELHAKNMSSKNKKNEQKIFVISEEDESDEQEVIFSRRDNMQSANNETEILNIKDVSSTSTLHCEEENVALLLTDANVKKNGHA